MKVSEFTKRKIARQVDELFASLPARYGATRYGANCQNPVTGARFVYGEDPIEPQKQAAYRILLQIEHFALNGPADAQPLRPVLYGESKELKRERFVLDYIVRYYARSVEDRDPEEHPSFADFASGLLWEAEHGNGMIPGGDQLDALKKRFPPRKLAGMDGFCWLTPEEYARDQERLRWRRDRELAWASYQKRVGTLEKPAPHDSFTDKSVIIPESVRRAAARANACYAASKTPPEN